SGECPPGAMVACATCHAGPFFTDGKAHRGVVVSGDPAFDPGEVRPDGTVAGFHTPTLLGLRLTAPYFHDGSGGDPTSPSNFFSGGLGRHSLDRDIGGDGTAVAPPGPLGELPTSYTPPSLQLRLTHDEQAALRRPGPGDRRPHSPRREGHDRAGHDQPRHHRRVREPRPGRDQGPHRLARRVLRRDPHAVPAERRRARSDGAGGWQPRAGPPTAAPALTGCAG